MKRAVTLDLYEIADEWSHALTMLQAEPSEDERDEHTEAIDRYAELCSNLGQLSLDGLASDIKLWLMYAPVEDNPQTGDAS